MKRRNDRILDTVTLCSTFILTEKIFVRLKKRYFIFLGSKIAADGYCSHEIKRYLLLGRKAMTSLDSILKSRDTSLPTKVCLWFLLKKKKKQQQSYGFSSGHVWM